MKLAYTLDGSAPIIKKYKVGATVARAGVPVMVDASNKYGSVIPCTTTSAADTYGVSVDAATYSTVQGATEGVVSVIINPFAVYRALMTGSATENTTLQALIPTGTSAGGTTITDADVGTAEMDGGTIWGVSGANAGQSRTLTNYTSATNAVVTVPFANGILTTDVYAECPWCVGTAGGGNVQLSTLLTQANAIIAVGTGIDANVVELDLNGLTNSYVLFQLADHVFMNNTMP
jgi:hypothetical protein